MAAINLDVGANTRRAERDIQKLVNRSYNINLKTKGDQPLGRITGKVNEFTKSLDASNARVIAFGASAGIIFGIQRAFDALARSVIDVQKSLQDINVILNVSTSQLQKFGGELFNIARNTGQSFQAVAEAATEFSRQGLGLEETLKRTNNALVLSRLSGLDAAKSVEALTAAVNSFASQAVTTTEIVNKFANVDAAFAVSSADLANAIARVGSSAAQSGVSLNELIAIVTSAQQTTARGGAVIGNSFKTIFTRLQRTQVVDLLENLGVNTKDSSGQIKTTISLLTDLAKVYDQLGTLQQSEVAEKVGGVFQINILKAALADLGKEYSIYNNALNVAASSTDEAIRRNQELNKTYAAQLNALQENARQLGANVGDRVFGPSFDRVVGGANKILGGVNESDGEGAGATLAKGILDGLGQVLAGPGLALIGGILIKLFKDLSKFATGSLQQLLGLNTASGQQRDLQQSITQILAKNPQLIEMALKGEQGLNTAANQLLANLQKQTIELQKQAQVAGQIAKVFYGAGVRVQGGVPTAPTPGRPGKAAGFVPNFAKNLQPGVSPGEAMGEVLGAKDVGYKVKPEEVYKRRIHKGDGSSMMATVSEAETVFDQSVQGTKGTWVIPPTGLAKGFVPNFASIENIAKLNKRVAERLSLSQSPRGDGRLQNEDLVNLSGRAFQQKQFPIDTKETFKKYEARVLQQSKALLGKNYRSGEELRFVTSAAVDGYNISQKGVETVIDLLEVKGGKNWNPTSVLNKFLRAVPENYLSNNPLDIFKKTRDKITVGATLVTPYTKEKAKPTQERLLRKRSVKAAAGFIPNFAKEIINLGDTVTAPQLKGKVSSLIYPAITEGLSKKEATATYLGQQYKGLVTTAGINQAEIKGEIPNLEKNVGNLLLREANEFGRAIGGQNLLKTPEDLPNYGGVKGAVGTSFEGGVTTLLREDLQKSSQTAGIDYLGERLSPKMKRLFHNAPGTYEAKYSPGLVNEVLAKMLKAANVGGVKVAKSGPGFGVSQALRAEALKNLQGQNLRRGPQLEKAIKEEMARISRARGMASGFIPNFASGSSAETNRGIPVSQIRAHFDGLGNPIAVTNKKDEPNGLKDAIGREKQGIGMPGKLSAFSGFIPNFAQDAAPAGIGQTVTALIAELGILAFVLKDFTSDIKTSQADIITSGNAQLEADRTRLSEVKKGTPEYDKLNKSIQKTDKYLKGTGPKIDAWASGVSNALIFAGPIIAQTIKNAIGTETKGARAAGSAIEGAGNALSAGAFAATLAPKGKGKIGGSVAALVAIFSALTGPLKEFGTDLPELSMAAKEANEKLSAFGNISQTVQTTFEQIQDLAGKGQVEEAGRVQQSLFADTVSQISDPNLQAKVITAIENKDAEALRKALEENTKKLTETNDIASRKEAVESGLQNLQNLQPGLLGRITGGFGSSKDIEKATRERIAKEKEAAKPIFNKGIFDVSGKGTATEKKDRLVQLRAEAVGSLEDYKNVLKQLGFSEEQIVKLADQEAVTRPALIALINDQIGVQRQIINNTGQGNKVIEVINKSLIKIRENYSKYSKGVAEATAAVITSKYEIQNALGRIAANADQISSDISETFFGENAVFAGDFQQKSAKAGLSKIDSDAQANISVPVTDALISVIDVIKSSADQKFTDVATIGESQASAEKNLAALPDVISEIGRSLDIGNLESLLNIPKDAKGNFNAQAFNGFKTEDIETELRKNSPKATEDQIKAVVTKLQEANRTLLEQKRIQTEQKILLAQNKLADFTKAIIGAVTSSFGGFEGFLKDDAGRFETFQTESAGLRILGQPGESKESRIEFSRGLGLVVTELNKIAGRNIGPNLAGGENGVVAQTIKDGQAASILDDLNTVFGDLNNFQGSQEIADAFRKTLSDQLGGQGQMLSNEEIASRTAEAQTNASLATGAVNEKIIAGAREQFKQSNPDLAPYLDNLNAAFADSETIAKIQLDTANNWLQQIAINTRAGLDSAGEAKAAEAAAKAAEAAKRAAEISGQGSGAEAPNAAGGYLPRFAAGSPMMVNSSEFIAKNAKKELQDMRKLGYSGEPMMLSAASGFNPEKDAILNPIQKQIFDQMGMFSNAKSVGNFAGGSMPGSLNTIRDITDAYLLDWQERETQRAAELTAKSPKGSKFVPLPVPKPGSFIPKWAEFGVNSVLPQDHPAMQMGPQTNITKAVEEAGKQISKPAANAPIKPSQLGGQATGSKATRLLSSADEAAIAASQAEVAAIRGVGTTVAETSAGSVAKTAATTVGKVAADDVAIAAAGATAKGVAKTGLRAVWGLGTLFGLGEGAYRAYQGDYVGAGLAAGAGLASLLPVGGTAVSLGLSGALLARDLSQLQDPSAGDVASQTVDRAALAAANIRAPGVKGKVIQGALGAAAIGNSYLKSGSAENTARGNNWDALMTEIEKDKEKDKQATGTAIRQPVGAARKNSNLGPRAATQDDIDYFFKRGKYAVKSQPEAVKNQPRKSISDIEADTRNRRDQKYLQSPIAPRNRTTGKKFTSIQEVDAEMTKALALGALRPEQKEYYKVLQNFKRNLDPTAGTSGRKAMFELAEKLKYEENNGYKLIGGKGDQPAMQINKRTGIGDYVPKATLPDQIIKRETAPKSQEELRKLMPPEYFRRLGKSYVDQISEAYNEQIKNTKDPAKAMALRKRADAIRDLYDQGIDSRTTDMDKFNELERIYKSMEQRPMSPEEYKKTPEYRNRIFSDNPMKAPKNAANGYMPMAAKDSIIREEMGGISKSDMVFQQRPELQGINNIQGLGLFSRNELGKERQAIAAKGYIPNFANALESQSASSVSLGGINLNINSSNAGADYSSLGEKVQALLENEIPKMMGELEKQQSAISNFNSTKATMDNMIKSTPSANRSQPPPSFTRQKTLKT